MHILKSWALSLTMLALPMPTKALEWIAHRGASFDAPENTLAAFNLAWAQGVPTVECDVYLTKDSQIVVHHDDNTLRTAGVDRLIRHQTLAELKRLDVGSWKGAFWKGEQIPTLAELLANVPVWGRICIEIKDGVDLLPHLQTVLDTCHLENDQLAIISFNYDVVVEAKKRFPGIEVLFIAELEAGSPLAQSPDAWVSHLVEKASAANLDGLSLDYSVLNKVGLIEMIKRAGLKLVVWTVNDLKDVNRLIHQGVNGITTDRAFGLRGSWGSLCQSETLRKWVKNESGAAHDFFLR